MSHKRTQHTGPHRGVTYEDGVKGEGWYLRGLVDHGRVVQGGVGVDVAHAVRGEELQHPAEQQRGPQRVRRLPSPRRNKGEDAYVRTGDWRIH